MIRIKSRYSESDDPFERRTKVDADPPYIEPSEELSEDERELTQVISDLLHFGSEDARRYAREIINLGWVPEAEVRRAEYERDRARIEVKKLRSEIEAIRTILDEEYHHAPEPEPEPGTSADVYEIVSGVNQVVTQYTVSNGPQPIRPNESDEESRARRVIQRLYNRDYKWRDL